MNALPALAPADMKLTEAPSFRGFPLYDADLQAKGFPPDVTALADAIRAADGGGWNGNHLEARQSRQAIPADRPLFEIAMSQFARRSTTSSGRVRSYSTHSCANAGRTGGRPHRFRQ